MWYLSSRELENPLMVGGHKLFTPLQQSFSHSTNIYLMPVIPGIGYLMVKATDMVPLLMVL